MNKSLLIEIKDTYANITLATFFQNKWAILMNKKYHFRSKIKDDDIIFDNSWIKNMKTEIQEIVPIVSLTNISLMVNTMGSLIKTSVGIFDIRNSNQEIKEKIKKELGQRKKSFAITGITINSVVKDTTKFEQKVSYTYELISKSFLLEIKNSFLLENIKINNVISVHEAMKKSIVPYARQHDFIYNVTIEEKFATINIFENGNFINAYKTSTGLDFIYSNIKEKMDISKQEARKLFKNIGNIPPSAVLDNKIILTRIHDDGTQTIFSKKDLSSYITESVNIIFQGVLSNLKEYQAYNPTLLFSGEISILNGFEAYAKVSLDVNSVEIFKTNLIGIEIDTNYFTVGALKKIQKQFENIKQNKIQLNKESYWVSSKKSFTQFLEKTAKYFSYI